MPDPDFSPCHMVGGGAGDTTSLQPLPPTPPSPGRNPGKCKEAGDTASHPARGPSWCMGQEEGPSLLDTPSHGSAAIKEPPVSGSRKVPLEPHSPLGESGGAHLTITCSAVLAPAEKWSSVQHARSRVTREGAKASSTPTFFLSCILEIITDPDSGEPVIQEGGWAGRAVCLLTRETGKRSPAHPRQLGR